MSPSRRARAVRLAALLAVVLPLVGISPASAYPAGGMDPTFGTGGVVVRDLGGLDIAYDGLVQPDGKVVALVRGTLLRFTASGLPDTTFGVDGVLPLPPPFSWASELALTPDGKIVIGGHAWTPEKQGYAAAMLLKADGTPDTRFGQQGWTGTSVGAMANAIAVTPSGQIYLAGISEVDGVRGFFVTRYHRNGAPDRSFGREGLVHVPAGPFSYLRDLAVQPADDKPILIGDVDDGRCCGDQQDIRVLRFTVDGAPDPLFAGTGQISLSLGGRDYARRVAALPSGDVLVAGDTSTTTGPRDSDSVLVRFTTLGVPDPSFGTAGVVRERGSGIEDVSGLVVDSAGRALVLVGSYASDCCQHTHVIRRYLPLGVRDATFGLVGEAPAGFLPGTEASGNDLELTANGAPVYIGHASYLAGGRDVALGRMIEDGLSPADRRPLGAALSGPAFAKAFWPSTSLPVRWSASDPEDAELRYDVRYRAARYDGAFGDAVLWRRAVTGTGENFLGEPGSTYCFTVQARDPSGNVSEPSPERCVAVPIDDRSLTATAAWSRQGAKSAFRITRTATKAEGATLALPGLVRTSRVTLLATTCADCGTVEVLSGTRVLGSVSLASATTRNRVLLPVWSGPAVTGPLTIRVTSSDRPVHVDGLGVRAVFTRAPALSG